MRSKLLAISRLLLEAEADPRARTKSWSHGVDASCLAISAANAEMLELLFGRGADPNGASAGAGSRALSGVGLRNPSTVRISKILAIDKRIIKKKLGSLTTQDRTA